MVLNKSSKQRVCIVCIKKGNSNPKTKSLKLLVNLKTKTFLLFKVFNRK